MYFIKVPKTSLASLKLMPIIPPRATIIMSTPILLASSLNRTTSLMILLILLRFTAPPSFRLTEIPKRLYPRLFFI